MVVICIQNSSWSLCSFVYKPKVFGVGFVFFRNPMIVRLHQIPVFLSYKSSHIFVPNVLIKLISNSIREKENPYRKNIMNSNIPVIFLRSPVF